MKSHIIYVLFIIFRAGPQAVKKKTLEAQNMLELWKSSYLEVRAKIEASGRDSRWEFDRKKLFDRTTYMANICKDLYNIAQVLEEFYNIFGPELKSVIGDPKKIEDVVKRVDNLVRPIKEVHVMLNCEKHNIQSCTLNWKWGCYNTAYLYERNMLKGFLLVKRSVK